MRVKRLSSIVVTLFTLLTHTVSAVPASGNGWVNEPLWREVYYGQSISGNPYIGETLVYNPGSWPIKPGVTHEWRLACCTPLNDSGVLSNALTFTPSENLAGITTLAMFTVDRSRKDVVYYSRTPVGRITCSPMAPPTLKVSHDPSKPVATLTISGGTNPSIAKSVGLPQPVVVRTQWEKIFEPNGEDETSWPNKTYDTFVGKNGQILSWSVYSKKIVRGWFFAVDCSSFSVNTTIKFGVVFNEAPQIRWSESEKTYRLVNDNQVWGNDSVQTYQWTSYGVPIPGATTSAIKSPVGGEINLEVTGSKPGWPSRTIAAYPIGWNQTPPPPPPGHAPRAEPINNISTPTLAPSTPPVTVGQPTLAPSTPPVTVGQPTPSRPETSPIPIVVEQSVAMKQLSISPKQASPALIKTLTVNEIRELSPKVFAQIPAITLNALSSAQARNVTSAQVVALSSANLKLVSPKVLSSLPAKTLAALPTSRLTQLTKSQKNAISASQLKSLTAAQRKAIGR